MHDPMKSSFGVRFRQWSAVPAGEPAFDAGVPRSNRIELENMFEVRPRDRAVVADTWANRDAVEQVADGRPGYIIIRGLHLRALICGEVRQPFLDNVIEAQQATVVPNELRCVTSRLGPLPIGESGAQRSTMARVSCVVAFLAAQLFPNRRHDRSSSFCAGRSSGVFLGDTFPCPSLD